MLVGKPHKQGAPQELDGGDNSLGLQNLATAQAASLLPAIDGLPYNNPDGANVGTAPVPNFLQGAPNGSPQASHNVSGRGVIHKTGITSAPKSNPFPSPSAPQTRTKTTTAMK